MAIEIRILKKEDDRSSFSCGEIALDYFFQRYAGQNQFKHYVGVTYVATDEESIFGFVSVSSGTIMRDDLPLGSQKKFPQYPLPILKITRIGVHKDVQNYGIGKRLLDAMLRLSLEQKHSVGCIGVTVDAKEDAIGFYKKLGFIELHVKRGLPKIYPFQTPMFLSINVIEKVVSEA